MIVELVCDGLPNKVLIRGTVVAWRPALPRLRVRAGATVEFAADEDDKRRFVLAALAGELKPPKRKHTRIPVAVPVRFRLPGSAEQLEGELTEISVGGALLKSSIAQAADGHRDRARAAAAGRRGADADHRARGLSHAERAPGSSSSIATAAARVASAS